MAINFPSTSGQPTDGSYTHTVGNVTWSWDGSSWTASSNTGSGGGGGGIDLTNLSVTSNSVGTAALSYNNTSGVFTYTPPDLSGYALAAHSHTYALNDLSNVNVSAPITDGHILNWDNTNNEWVASGNINIDGNINLEGHIELGPVNATKISATDATLGHWNTVIENSTNGDIFIKGAELLLQANHTGVTKTWVHGNTDYSVDLYHDGDVALSTSEWGIQVEANSSSIPGLQGQLNVGASYNCLIEAYSDDSNNTVEDNNTFKIYSQHGDQNTTKTGILYESFFDQVWRVYGEGGSGCSGISHAELGRINHDGGWELRYHDIQGTAPNWTGTTCDKKLETTAGGVDVTGALDVSGKLTVTGIDNDGQYNIKPGGEFFKFENTSAWHLVYDHATLQQSHYAINVNKTYTRLYGGEPASADDWSLQATSSGVDVTGDLDVTGSITLNGSAITGGGGGGGATALDGLSDVNVSASILPGDILTWDTTNTEWVSSSNIDINGNITATGNTHNLEGTLSVGGPAGNDNGIIKLSSRGFNITANSSGNGGSEATGYTTYNTIIQSGNEDLFVNVDDSTRFIVRGSVSSSQGNQGTEELARFTPGAGVELMHDNSKKLETTADGVTITGDLTVNGTTTEINSTTLTVDDKNIELATVADISGQTATITAGQSTVTVTSTAGYLEGATVTKTGSEAGDFNAASVTIDTIDANGTDFTVSANHATTGAITFDVENKTDLTANGGGITLKGTTDKTILWTDSTDSWDFNQDIKTSGTVSDSNGDVRILPQIHKGASDHALSVADSGFALSWTPINDNQNTVTVNDNVFSGGEEVTVLNHSDKILMIGKSANMNLYNSADGTLPTALAGRSMATFFFYNSANCYVSIQEAGGGGTLQQVTDLGSSTTNDITANKFSDTSGDVRSLSGVAHTAAYTITDRTYVGRLISTTANVTVNGTVLQIGDAITVYNNSASPISISQGSGVTLTLAGTNSGGNRSVDGTGIATILCIDSTGNNFVVTGTGVT